MLSQVVEKWRSMVGIMCNPVNAFGECLVCECHWFFVVEKQVSEPLELQCLWYRGKRGLCFHRFYGLDEKTGHICTVKMCIRKRVSMYMCQMGGAVCSRALGWHPRGQTVCGDWFIREGRFELCHGESSPLKEQLYKMLSLPTSCSRWW